MAGAQLLGGARLQLDAGGAQAPAQRVELVPVVGGQAQGANVVRRPLPQEQALLREFGQKIARTA